MNSYDNHKKYWWGEENVYDIMSEKEEQNVYDAKTKDNWYGSNKTENKINIMSVLPEQNIYYVSERYDQEIHD